jgi:hypothetical protein
MGRLRPSDVRELAIQRGQHLVDPRRSRRSGAFAGMRPSRSTYEVTAPLIRSPHPRLPIGKNTGIIFAHG